RELIDRFLALLEDCLQELNRLVLVEFAEFFHFLQLNRSFDHTQHAQLEVVSGFHGDDNVRLDFFRKTHFFLPRNYNRKLWRTFSLRIASTDPETRRSPCLTLMLPLGNYDSFRVTKKLRRRASFLFLEELII